MRLLLCGDVVGRTGRAIVTETIPRLRHELALDFVVVNGENAAGGFGISDKICQELYAVGVDVITTGNHVWDRREIIPYIAEDPKLLRPANFPKGTPGNGSGIFGTADGRRVLVVNLMGRLFMDALDDPFAAIETVLAEQSLGTVDAIIVDFHGEATSEKMSMGHALDGRVSLVVGTHSHVPTADAQILPRGTGYMTDAGMCGDYDSVIGMQKEAAIARFVRKMPGERLQAADGPATLCGVVVETDDATGLARHIAPVRVGGRLAPHWPAEFAPGQ
ncbi:MAG: TIGR00282 family metallophosphoesterase [Alphaproteobacteria bacterium]|nr:TIGR00282 family metallophosphoesterase [Alphaproteobacteria bacterium]